MRCVVSLSLFALPACATPGGRPSSPAGPQYSQTAPVAYVNPYQAALDCVASQLTPAQRNVVIGVGYFADRTGRDTYSQENGAGRFFSQGSEDQLINDLSSMGMIATDMSPAARALTDWQIAHTARTVPLVPFAMPDVMVSGSIGNADFGISDVSELYVAGIGGGRQAYSLRYVVDARAVRAPSERDVAGLPNAAGALVSHAAFRKDVVGYQTRVGVAGFFGPASSPTYVQFNVGRNNRELVQYSQRFVVTRTAVELVANLWHITACSGQIAYGDQLITGQFPNANALRLRGRQ